MIRLRVPATDGGPPAEYEWVGLNRLGEPRCGRMSEAQAYHLWYLSYTQEGGDGFPKTEPGQPPRIFQWFAGDVRAQFEEWQEGGVTPVDLYPKSAPPPKRVKLSMTEEQWQLIQHSVKRWLEVWGERDDKVEVDDGNEG